MQHGRILGAFSSLDESQSPYGAQSLATSWKRFGALNAEFMVAIPLRGSIPCNCDGPEEEVSPREGGSQSPYGAQSLAT